MKGFRWSCLFVLILVWPAPGAAQPVVKLFGSGTDSRDRFGSAVAIHGNGLVIGARSDRFGPPEFIGGRAYIFQYENGVWSEEAVVGPAPPFHQDTGFGRGVALRGDLVVVGAPNESYHWDPPPPNNTTWAGAVYVYRRQASGAWAQEARLIPEGVLQFHYTGAAVAATIGADGTEYVGARSHRAVVIFARAPGGAWAEQTRLPVDWAAYPSGIAESLSASTAAAGPFMVSPGTNRRVLVFRGGPGGWGLEQAITGTGLGLDDNFGAAVAADGDRILIGAPYTPMGWPTPPSGKPAFMYRYRAGVWELEARLFPPEPRVQFGNHVALDGEWAIVGNAGLAHLALYRRFEHEGDVTWALVAQLLHPQPGRDETLRGLSALRTATGHSFDDELGIEAGAAFVFDFNTVVPTEPGASPATRAALSVYPNPSAGAVRAEVVLEAPQAVRAGVYDVLGREVRRLHDGVLGAGRHPFPVAGLGPGVYVVRVQGSDWSQVQRLVVR